MKAYVILAIAVTLCFAGCGTPKATNPIALEPASPDPTTATQETSSEFELRIERAKAERLGFSFERMGDHFSRLKMSKHLYSADFVGDTFVIRMRETPTQLKLIMEFSLKTDTGQEIKVDHLCTVSHKGD